MPWLISFLVGVWYLSGNWQIQGMTILAGPSIVKISTKVPWPCRSFPTLWYYDDCRLTRCKLSLERVNGQFQMFIYTHILLSAISVYSLGLFFIYFFLTLTCIKDFTFCISRILIWPFSLGVICSIFASINCTKLEKLNYFFFLYHKF